MPEREGVERRAVPVDEGRHHRRMEPGPEGDDLPEDAALAERCDQGVDLLRAPAHDGLVRAVVMGDHDAVERSDGCSRLLGAAAQGGVRRVGQLRPADSEQAVQIFAVLRPPHARHDHRRPLSEAVTGEQVGDDPEPFEGAGKEAAHRDDVGRLVDELAGPREQWPGESEALRDLVHVAERLRFEAEEP